MTFFGGTSFAKYIFQKDFSVNISSQPFYINSEISTNNVYVENNKGNISLKIKNNDGTNFNNYETKYEIYLEDTTLYTITINDENSGQLIGGEIAENNIEVQILPISRNNN